MQLEAPVHRHVDGMVACDCFSDSFNSYDLLFLFFARCSIPHKLGIDLFDSVGAYTTFCIGVTIAVVCKHTRAKRAKR